MSDRLMNLLFGVLLAAIMGLASWAYAQGVSVAKLDRGYDLILATLYEMQTDIREIRALLLERPRRATDAPRD
jgi:hypothetical protein